MDEKELKHIESEVEGVKNAIESGNYESPTAYWFGMHAPKHLTDLIAEVRNLREALAHTVECSGYREWTPCEICEDAQKLLAGEGK